MTGFAPAGLLALADEPEPPTLASVADDLYDAVLPLAWQDAEVGFHLAYLCGALGVMFQAVADVARDTDDGPGWSAVVDVNRCPDPWLAWLAQFVGVSLVPGTTPAEQRARILSTDGFKRGTVAAMRSAAQLHLIGARSVIFTERFEDDAYVLAIRTLAAETPDAAQTRADILSQKPAGIVLDYDTLDGQTYDAVRVTLGDYAEVRDTYATYEDMRSNTTV
jgi:tail protein P2 I